MNSQPFSRFPYHIVVSYCITGALWILFSDHLLGTLVPVEYFELISIAKGWLFVIVTAFILTMLLLRYHRTQTGLERRMREIIDNLPSFLYVYDRNGLAVSVNRSMAELFGIAAEECRGKSREELGLAAAAAVRHRANDLQVFASGQANVFEEENIQADGLHTYLTVKFPLTNSDGSIEAVCGVSTDITTNKRLEEQLRQSQKMEAIGQLAGGVAHDFNNILSVIIGYSFILKMGTNLDGQQQEKIDQIIAAAEKAAQLTRGLLSFSRKHVLTLQTVNLKEIVQSFQKFLMRIIGEDIHLQTVLTEVDLPVSVDSGQIEQVLVNLATNARDAMPQGGLLTIETELEELDAKSQAHSYGQAGRYAVITVSDTGSGMSEETRQKIFEPFFTTKETGKGTGLGLAIVYGIIKQHNGFINLYSEAGKGTTFRIYLPLASQDALPTQEPAMAAPPPSRGSETILVAEDDPAVRKLVTTVLTEYGYMVVLAGDGDEAVRQFIANRDRISLILMDMIMPGQSGKAAADEIRKLAPDIKILFTSGYTADFIKNRGVNEQGLQLIMKPVQPLQLLRRVRELLDR